MTYVPPKTVLDTFVDALRDWEGEPLASCVFRRGPQYGIKLTAAQPCACIVAVRRMVGGEEAAGSGNNFRHTWELAVLLLVRDDPDDPEGAEDMRLDLVEEFGQFMALMDTRTMFDGAKIGRISMCEFGFGQYFENDDTIYRYAEVSVEYRTLRSGSNVRSE